MSKKWKLFLILAVAVIWYLICLPAKLFDDPYSPVLHSREGELLSASIARDGQWRFPPSQELSMRYREAIITFEDKRFPFHPGVDVLSFARALKQNIEAGKVVSGGSTITMQVIRLSRKDKPRTFLEKIVEIVLATRLELRHSKVEILQMYAAHAPFGGNVVGIDAACWRYFGRGEKQLSWAEAALLAVLPNAPSLIHPGRNRSLLQVKRDNLLEKLFLNGTIDSLTCELAKAESLPERPHPIPRYARHLLSRMESDGNRGREYSTIDYSLQLQIEDIVRSHHERLRANQIHNAAILVAEVNSGNVVAYVGNVASGEHDGAEVDIIQSPRSTGSILKPFLFAAMLDEGKLLPGMLLPDIPTFINGFTPKNFSHGYDGAVPAERALIRSLNIPAVHMLRDYRYERFHGLLKQLGMTTLNRPPDHYGLSLILGGAEGTLWDITGMYASMARSLNQYSSRSEQDSNDASDFRPLRYIGREGVGKVQPSRQGVPGAGSIFQTFEALKELYRPGEESGWRYFQSSKPIAWKTGTSFGFRDGWAVGVTPEYVVGIWAGNADGEGRPGLTGSDAAAPILFDVFSRLGGRSWFKRPSGEMQKIYTCPKSGHRKTENCIGTDTVWVVKNGLESLPCPYHQKVHLTKDRKFQVNSACVSPAEMLAQSWFVLPPIQELYYKRGNLSYKPLPPLRADCPSSSPSMPMELIYPRPESRVFIPRDLSGREGDIIFQLAHRSSSATVFWHIDGQYIGSTRKTHHLALNPSAGKHRLLVMDDKGEVLEQDFEVLPNL